MISRFNCLKYLKFGNIFLNTKFKESDKNSTLEKLENSTIYSSVLVFAIIEIKNGTNFEIGEIHSSNNFKKHPMC